ncbi:hypothetical protein Tco_0002274 [Tanacetum coccineum]
MEEAGPSATEKPTNGSVHLGLDLENDDDDMMINAPSVRDLDQPPECMTRSSTNELFTPFKDPEREFRSSRKHFKTLSLDELRSPDFNLFFNQENSEEEVAETMEQYMRKTRADYGSRVARPKLKTRITLN